MFEQYLQNLLQKAVFDATGQEEKIVLETPKHDGHGDFSTPIAMKIGKEEGKNPREVAQNIINNIPKNTVIENVEIAGPGFINITLDSTFIAEELENFDPTQVLENPNPKRIMVEFGNPNIAKPLHFGHFRGLIIGESLARILRFTSHNVLTDNFIGNWGTQFGKLIVAIRKWGNNEDIDKNPTEELVKLYRKFHEELEKNPELEKEGAEEFRKMEQDRDEENLKLWEWIVGESMKDFEKIAIRLGAHFDVIRGEAFYEKMLPNVLHRLEESGVGTVESGGALVVHFPEETKLPTMIFRKTDGATLYQTRDLAKVIFYNTEGFDEMVYVVANDQSLHFRQFLETARMLGYSGTYIHVAHGMVRLPEGKMSTRAGRSIGLEEVLDEAKKRSFDILTHHNTEFSGAEKEELAEIIAIGALKFNDLSQNLKTDITFDWEKMLSFEGYSAPFLQYSAVRCKSILRKEGLSTVSPPHDFSLPEPEELVLAKKILAFPHAVFEAEKTLEPHHLAQYLFELASEFNRFYSACSVLNAENDSVKNRRLFLTNLTGKTLEHGLFLLGIQTPERM
ncbi:arginine--tRNA ligase [Candidatus Peregrinibacteria bacterium]|nr:MAG: arginine--tRNA ligase [Candidatus Peregrinibacteria bacterium]